MLFTLNAIATVTTIHTVESMALGNALHKFAKNDVVESVEFATDLGCFVLNRDGSVVAEDYLNASGEVELFFTKVLGFLVRFLKRSQGIDMATDFDYQHHLVECKVDDYYTTWCLYNPVTDVLFSYDEAVDHDENIHSWNTQHSIDVLSSDQKGTFMLISEWLKPMMSSLINDYPETVEKAINNSSEDWDDLPF